MQPKTIANCFRHANFQRTDPSADVTDTISDTDDDTEDDITLARLVPLGLTANLRDYMTIDDILLISERLTNNDIIDDIISSRSTEFHEFDDDAENTYADRRDTESPTTLSEAMDVCAKLRNYFEQCEHSDDFLISLGRMTDVLMKQDFSKRCGKQTLITGFFSV